MFWIGPDDPLGPDPGYPHPRMVVQDDAFNHSRITTVVVCALTSNLRRANWPGNVLLEASEGNLPKQSVVGGRDDLRRIVVKEPALLRHPTPGSFLLRVLGSHPARFRLPRPRFGAKLAPERVFPHESRADGAAIHRPELG